MPHLVAARKVNAPVIAYDWTGNQLLCVIYLGTKSIAWKSLRLVVNAIAEFNDGSRVLLPRLWHPALGAFTLDTTCIPVASNVLSK